MYIITRHLTLSSPVPNNSCSRGRGGCQKGQRQQVGQRYEGGQTLDKRISLRLRRRLDDEDRSVMRNMTLIRGMMTLSSVPSIPRAVSLCVVFSTSIVIPRVIIVEVSLIVVRVGKKSLLHLGHCETRKADAGMRMSGIRIELNCYVGEEINLYITTGVICVYFKLNLNQGQGSLEIIYLIGLFCMPLLLLCTDAEVK